MVFYGMAIYGHTILFSQALFQALQINQIHDFHIAAECKEAMEEFEDLSNTSCEQKTK